MNFRGFPPGLPGHQRPVTGHKIKTIPLMTVPFVAAVLLVSLPGLTRFRGAVATAQVQNEETATAVPDAPREVLQKYCVDCHQTGAAEGGIILDVDSINWPEKDNLELWEKVLHNSSQSRMPPPGSDQPTAGERKLLGDWIDDQLSRHLRIGGTAPRRLNQAEYLKTVRELVSMRDYELPPGFPGDSEVHGFDNMGEGLVMSPAHIASYSRVATEIADLLYPQPRKAVSSRIQRGGVEDLVLSFSASAIKEGKLRLASSARDIMRSCTWPQQHQAKVSGVYRVTVDGSVFKPRDGDLPMILEVRARQVSASERSVIDNFRFLKDLPFTSKKSQTHAFETELYKGETLSFRWKNAEFDHNNLKATVRLMTKWFERDKRWLAAWQQAVFPGGLKGKARISTLRGLNGWNVINKALQDPNLDMSEATMDSPETKELLRIFGTVGGGTHNLGDALCHYYFNQGPSLQLHGYTIEGPTRLVDSDVDKRYQQIARSIAGTGKGKLGNEEYARTMLAKFLPRAFRRPVDKATLEAFLKIASEHWEKGHTFHEGMHLLMRNILISPQFLYRSLRPGELDDHDLAVRLSYFFTQGPPDAQLAALANAGKLTDSKQLRTQAKRLMPNRREQPLVRSFTGQWLDTRGLKSIMPDPKFKFEAREINIAQAEVELFFLDMIRENRPLRDFIDPDFTWTAPYFAERIYQIKGLRGRHDKLQRVKIPRGSRHGGLLGMSAIMMTTANGVDTQPVLRGAWVLENILGISPPEPPDDVPALTPDTRGTSTPREMLAAHTGEDSCLNCHRHIDPLGFALENFDPVGKWREKWPGTNRQIDASATLTDGTKIKDVVDLKKWLVSNESIFAFNLASKLMMYATGRPLNYVEKKEIRQLVASNLSEKGGMRDLILDLVVSQTFRTK